VGCTVVTKTKPDEKSVTYSNGGGDIRRVDSEFQESLFMFSWILCLFCALLKEHKVTKYLVYFEVLPKIWTGTKGRCELPYEADMGKHRKFSATLKAKVAG
jgi:hypothetical protein